MKKWYRYLAAGVLVLLTLCVAGCGGVSHKSPEKVTEELKKLKKTDEKVDIKLRDYMCDNFFDIRTFGAVMTTFVKASLNCPLGYTACCFGEGISLYY